VSNKDKELRDRWNRFIEDAEPHRIALFRYCLGLTRNPFDAEDLVSETVMKTFVSRAFTENDVESIIAFMIRVASRLWIDEQRRNAKSLDTSEIEETSIEDFQSLVGDAANALYNQLQPEQRAVLVLKEVFDMSHKEISKALSVSEEKSRVTLHRSKSILSATKRRKPRVAKQLVERFVEAFLSHDLDGVKDLLLSEVEATVFPLGREISAKDNLEWLRVSFAHMPSDLQIHDVLGDLAILVFRKDEKQDEALEEVWLIEENAGLVSRVIDYGVSPVLVGWVAEFCGQKPRDARFRFTPEE